ncbi:ATP-binding protein (plasmid) [Enterobacter asburiae]|uniref:ATP-binding protein n=1 Tax=Enterobacter asburiae TaxID=61645 RepID=UPI0038557FC8
MRNKVMCDILNKSNKAKARMLLETQDCHILVTGDVGTGKTTLLECANIQDAKYFHFPELVEECLPPVAKDGKRELCEENFDDYGFLAVPETTLILDRVCIPEDIRDSKIVHFIKTARKHGKRLVIATYPEDAREIKSLFGVVITLSLGVDREVTCDIDVSF